MLQLNKADYRKTHSDKIAQYDEARNFLKSVYPDSDYPDLNQLKNQRKQILTDYKSLNSFINDCSNILFFKIDQSF